MADGDAGESWMAADPLLYHLLMSVLDVAPQLVVTTKSSGVLLALCAVHLWVLWAFIPGLYGGELLLLLYLLLSFDNGTGLRLCCGLLRKPAEYCFCVPKDKTCQHYDGKPASRATVEDVAEEASGLRVSYPASAVAWQ